MSQLPRLISASSITDKEATYPTLAHSALGHEQHLQPLAKPSLVDLAAHYGHDKAVKAPWYAFGLAIFAGAFIALAFVFYITVTTGAGDLPWGFVRLAGGLAFSLGLILVVVCGAELFTSTVLTTIAWAKKTITTGQLLRCWARVYSGNLVGALLMLALVMEAGLWQLDLGQWGLNALHIAQHKIHHSWGQAFTLGVLCNLLVCLGIWMTFSSKDMLTKSLLLVLPVAMFVSSGFEHSIANLFMVPLGIAIHTFASDALASSLAVNPVELTTQFNDLTLAHFILNNLIPVTLGNIVGGGLLVGLGYWAVEQGKQPIPTTIAMKHNPISIQDEQEMKNVINQLAVKDLMDTSPVTLSAEMNVYQAIELLAEQQARCAAVVDPQQRLLGFVSEQDLLRAMWSEEYSTQIQLVVGDLMQFEILTVAPNDSVAQLLESMVVDKEALFPVSSTGMYLGGGFQSYEARLRSASARRPSAYPVVEQGQLCGMIQREHILKCLVRGHKPKQIETQNEAVSAA
ncbi:formate transporter FocA [Motilimonas eburnea]|uniref:formate transporter FocA n=1 Tax=Motilimonas eburnea TaxID=1737488 RepID=UPI001E5878A2|nr:formate transporter FocA [Motilimonas eburnea]MCE2569893.1 formate transporter FocA [Motilimonas eburnea]